MDTTAVPLSNPLNLWAGRQAKMEIRQQPPLDIFTGQVSQNPEDRHRPATYTPDASFMNATSSAPSCQHRIQAYKRRALYSQLVVPHRPAPFMAELTSQTEQRQLFACHYR